ncbi:TorF family putative porin [Hansschlegelia quercus]|uniref:Porin n=1 Tax=Hansschlegelia quercus TaxID=2528245 RepID=A0A4Q9GB32_9HYPH|nr:TorF family putative porin [Hansschlegelia quercus]TBN48342.1 hypothetical protein EYR15_14825 [Hansschlegelia quercus]
MKKLAGLALSTLMSVSAVSMISGAAIAADLPVAEPAMEVVPAWDVAFGVAGVTDYRYRGITNSAKGAAVQGYAELQTDWFYIGSWGSSVSFPTRLGLSDPAAEVDLYGGFRHTWDAFTLDVGALYYYYPKETGFNTDYWEFKALPSYAFGDFGSITFNAWYSRDYANTGQDEIYLSLAPKVNIPVSAFPDIAFYVSGEIGKQWYYNAKNGARPANDYWTYNVGGGMTYKAMTLDVRYSDTDLSKNECDFNTGVRNWCGSAVVGKIAFDTSFNKIK